MNNVYSFFTRQLIESETLIIKESPAIEKASSWSVSDVLLGKIEARYGNNQPKLLRAAARPKKPQKEPYAYGCTSNILWSEIRNKYSRAGYWNRPMPFPASFTKESIGGVLGKEVKKGGTDPCMWMDLKYRRTLESGAPSKARRLDAFRVLKEAGFNVDICWYGFDAKIAQSLGIKQNRINLGLLGYQIKLNSHTLCAVKRELGTFRMSRIAT